MDDLPHLKPLRKLRVAATALLVTGLILGAAFSAIIFRTDLILEDGDPIAGTPGLVIALTMIGWLVGIASLVIGLIWLWRAWENADMRAGMPFPAAVAMIFIIIPWLNSFGQPLVAFLLLRGSRAAIPFWFWPWAALSVAALAYSIAGLAGWTVAFSRSTVWINLVFGIASTLGLIGIMLLVEQGQNADESGIPGLPDYEPL